jgi:hypothetical protein
MSAVDREETSASCTDCADPDGTGVGSSHKSGCESGHLPDEVSILVGLQPLWRSSTRAGGESLGEAGSAGRRRGCRGAGGGGGSVRRRVVAPGS